MLKMINRYHIFCNREWCEEIEESSSSGTHLRIPGYFYLVGMEQVTIVHSENTPYCHIRGSHLFYHQHFPAPFNTSYQQLLWSLVARTSDLPSDLLKLQSIGKPHLAHGFVYFDKVNKVHPGFPELLESHRIGRGCVRRECRQDKPGGVFPGGLTQHMELPCVLWVLSTSVKLHYYPLCMGV